jgi:hypothetical protein
MPRSKIGGKLTGVRLPDSLRLEIEVLAGPGHMAEFVRAAVEAEVARRRREEQDEAPLPDTARPELSPKTAPRIPSSPWATTSPWLGYGFTVSGEAVEVRLTPPITLASAPEPIRADQKIKVQNSPIPGARVRSPSRKPSSRKSDHPAHSAWTSMRQQSRISGHPIAPEWENFWIFVKDMKKKPLNAVLVRKDQEKGWGPDNCVWGTKADVVARRPTTGFYTYNGRTLTLTGWSKVTNINVGVLRARVRAEWPIEEVLGTPVGPGPGKRGRPVLSASVQEAIEPTVSLGRRRMSRSARNPVSLKRSDNRYLPWKGMRERCGRTGDSFVPEWEEFWVFAQDLGERPPGTVLLRRKLSLPYGPTNCFWGTKKQANRGRRFVRRYMHDGREMTVAELAEATGLGYKTLDARLRKGIPLEQALSPKVRPRPGRSRR